MTEAQLAQIERWRVVGYKAGMRIIAQLLVLFPLLWVEGVWAVDCQNAIYQLTSQAQVNAFPQNCDTVTGHLSIGGSTEDQSDPITNLDALGNLAEIHNLYYYGRSLESVDGLANLRVVNDLQIRVVGSENSLGNLDALRGLTNIPGRLTLEGVVQTDGLINVAIIGEALSVSSNFGRSVNLDGLANLQQIGGIVLSGGGITSFPSTPSGVVSEVAVQNTGLDSLEFLSNLTGSSHTFVTIGGNNALITLSGLEGLGPATGVLQIFQNAALQNLDALIGIVSVERTQGALPNLMVFENYSLRGCEAIAPILGWPAGPPSDNVAGTISIYRNDSGCNSASEILASV